MSEQALMSAVLSRLEGLKEYKEKLNTFLRSRYVSSPTNWNWYVEKYDKAVVRLGNEYLPKMESKLTECKEFEEIRPELPRNIEY